MEIKQLQHFSRIAEIGNLTRAASVLGLTQAALSRQVAQLEAELGTELFRRNGRGLVLTEAGQRLLDHVPIILRQIALAERAVRGSIGPAQGTLVLGLPPSLARTVVVPLIDAFREQLPEVTLRTVDGLSANLVELVGIGKLDCSVVYNQPPSDVAELRLLADEELYLVAGPMIQRAGKALPSSLTLADVAALPLVTAGTTNAVHAALATAMAALGLKPQVVHEIENLTAILDLVRKGYGSAVIPLSGVHPCIGDPKLRLHRITKPVLRCSLSVATPARALHDMLIGQGTSLVREVVRQQLVQFHTDVERAIDA
ncbi:LysR family transcriptional regulator [Paraburkholderia sp. IMGN_8]|uniref:LysR family transcriptional regulator n=1 Tax=Paraburkholderia sp. IMGN_8 TaxID=3136564 RepID=UPI0031014CAB